MNEFDKRAESYMRSVMNNDSDVFTRADLYEYIVDAWKAGYKECEKDIAFVREPLFKPGEPIPKMHITDKQRKEYEKLMERFKDGENHMAKALTGWLAEHLFEDCISLAEAHAEFIRDNQGRLLLKSMFNDKENKTEEDI